MSFRPKDERQLEQLSDEQLVEYLVEARDAGYDEAVRTATSILVFRRYRQQLAIIRKKVKSLQDAEDILGDVILDMLSAAFRGNFTGEFFSLYFTIRNRRIADYYKKIGREPVSVDPRPDGPDLIEELLGSEEFTSESEVRMLIHESLSGESGRNREIIRMRIEGLPSRDVAEEVNQRQIGGETQMSPANVDQIFARFKHRLRPELFPDEGGD